MDCKVCGKCGARFFPTEDGGYQLRWATGAEGKPEDLAGLVCNSYGDEQCINPARGSDKGDTWAKRLKELERLEDLSDR